MKTFFVFAEFSCLLTAVLSACPDLYVAVGDSCYRASTGQMDWYGAQQFCVQDGGYLAEIRDENEQAALPSFLVPEILYWIGLTDFASEGTFVWQTDFSSPEYTYWESGEPNNDGGQEDCVLLNTGFYWNDKDCYSSVSDPAGNGVFANIHALCEANSL